MAVLAEKLLSLNAAFPCVVLLTFAVVAEALRCRQVYGITQK